MSKGFKCKLKEIRLKEYMIDSKSEFARMIDISIQTYIKWENEESTPPLLIALKVAKKLNKRVEEIWHLE
ncbi:MAG: helix-turn-helix domain-containing protein [Bacillota bacterium]|nr:helix-turn-helix domain-containing protein [Bacillota bacterium]